jgi:DNA-binding LacI/PurR family transcriptional regulator
VPSSKLPDARGRKEPAPERPVTMKDVAAAAGVSQSTVSRILNDVPVAIPVSDRTRERVLELARELGYRPHPFARALRGAPSMLLGAIVRDITDVFFPSAVEALSIEARARGYSVVLGTARAEADEALALTAVLEARQCDAIVLLGDLRDEPRLVDDLRRARVPVVALWHGAHAAPFATISVDNRAGIRAALGHLHELGHRRVAFCGNATLLDVYERRAAFVERAAELGLPAGPELVRHTDNTFAGGEAALDDLLAAPDPPTAVIAATDVIAIGLIHAAYERGVRVPDDLSVVGFDDVPLAAAVVPGLTTVQMPVAAMVGAAVERVVDAAAEEDAPAPPPFVPRLVVRGSSGPPAD